VSRLAWVLTLTVLAALVPGAVFARPAETSPAYRTLSVDNRMNHVAVIGDSYTTGTDLGGLGPHSWTALAWQSLAASGVRVTGDVAAEGQAGYAVTGDHGSVFEDLTGRVVKSSDELAVFFGSRNDISVPAPLVADRARSVLRLAHRLAPAARVMVIGPPWPTADVPAAMLQIRDVLHAAARASGAAFVDPISAHWFVDRPDLIGPDGVHPNDAGHQYLADRIVPLIRTQLSG
jgi:lysophospholipase L1-like esterase